MSLPLGIVPLFSLQCFLMWLGFSHLSPQKEIGSLHFLPIVLVTIFRLEPSALWSLGKVPVAHHRKCSLRGKRFRAFWFSFHFSRGQNRESRFSIFLCSETEKRKRLLRRLWEMWFQWTEISWQKKRETRTLLFTASLLIKTFILSWTHFVHRIISVAKPSCRQKRIPLRNSPSTKTYSDSTGCTRSMAW